MSKQEFASIMLKLLGIYALLQAVIMVPPLIQSVNLFRSFSEKFPIPRSAFFDLFFPVLLLVAVAVILLAGSDSLARKLIKVDDEFSLFASLSGREFQAICFSAVGVFVFLFGIPAVTDFFAHLWSLANARNHGAIVETNLLINAWMTGICIILRFGLALYLFFRAPRLADYWHRIHNIPQPPEPQ